MVAVKKTFFKMHNNFGNSKAIPKCKNDKPWKNYIGKVPAPPLLRRPDPAP